MYFEDAIECPECGYSTSELLKATSKHSGERVLMCQECYGDSEEGLQQINEYGEPRDDEWAGDLLL